MGDARTLSGGETIAGDERRWDFTKQKIEKKQGPRSGVRGTRSRNAGQNDGIIERAGCRG